jgi:hypothetical protein
MVVDLLVVCGSLALVSALIACMLGMPAALGDLNFLRLDRAVGDLAPGMLLCGGAAVCFAGCCWQAGGDGRSGCPWEHESKEEMRTGARGRQTCQRRRMRPQRWCRLQRRCRRWRGPST